VGRLVQCGLHPAEASIAGFQALMWQEPVARRMRADVLLAVSVSLLMVFVAATPAVGAAVALLPRAQSLAGTAATATSLEDSENWAGYVATGADGTVTLALGSWVEVAVNCASSKTTYLATWVGIDGFNTDDLVQTGTGASCVDHVASYNAWWEVLPAPESPISTITVSPGDLMNASVTYSSGDFTMLISDVTTGVSFSKTEKVSSTARDAAECIVERPEVGVSLARLAKFTSDTFSYCSAEVSGVVGGIGSFASVYEIDMVTSSGKLIAATGTLSASESSFSVKWKGYG